MSILEGKVAVVTGASRGLGLAIAELYAREGAAVILAARTQARLEKAEAHLRAQGLKAIGQVCDVTDLDSVTALADLSICEFGGIDIWVNNAGVGAPYGPTTDIPPERFTRVVHTNILGAYYGSHVAMNYFIEQGSGKLINLVGRGEHRPVPFQNAYASSKAWVSNFSRTLAKETRDSGVEVLIFNPGLVKTDMLASVEAVEGFDKQAGLVKYFVRMWAREPHEAAQKALWLASSATNGKTGKDVSLITPLWMLRGALREGLRWLLRRPAPEWEPTVYPQPVYKQNFAQKEDCESDL